MSGGLGPGVVSVVVMVGLVGLVSVVALINVSSTIDTGGPPLLVPDPYRSISALVPSATAPVPSYADAWSSTSVSTVVLAVTRAGA